MINFNKKILFTVLATIFASPLTYAEDYTINPDTQDHSGANNFTVSADARSYSEADMKGFSGTDTSVTRFSSKVQAENDFLTIGYEYSKYRFENFFLDKDIKFNKFFVDICYGDEFANNWGYLVGIEYAAAYETDFNGSDNYQFTPYAIATYQIDSDWKFAFGAAPTITKPDSFVDPIVNFYYRDAKDLGLSFEVGYPDDTITYRFNDKFALRGKVDGFDEFFMLDSSSSINGYLRFMKDHSYQYDIAAIWNPIHAIAITGGVGYSIDHTITLYNNDGNEIRDYDLESQPLLFASIAYSF
jgi:hypothetical protein